MRQVNNEKYGSKKFFKGIDSTQNYNSNYEILQKKKLEEMKTQEIHYNMAIKENINSTKISVGEVEIETKNDLRKPPKETKKRLKRGMTVKFQADEDILSLVEKNNEMVRMFCKDKKTGKKASLRQVSVTKPIRSKSVKSNPIVKANKRKKPAKVTLKRAKSKSFANHQYLSQAVSLTPIENIMQEDPNTMFEKTRLPTDKMKLQTRCEYDYKFRDMVIEQSSNTTKEASQTMVLNKA